MLSLINKVGELSNAATQLAVKGANCLASVAGIKAITISAKDLYHGDYSKGARNLREGLLRLTVVASTIGVIAAGNFLLKKTLDSSDYCIEIRPDNTTSYRYFGSPCDVDSRIMTFCQKLFSPDMYSYEELPNCQDEKLCFQQLKEFKSPQPQDFFSEKILSKISPLTAPQLTVLVNAVKDYCQPSKQKFYKIPITFSDIRRCVSTVLSNRILFDKVLERAKL